MNQIKILSTAIMLAVLACLGTACTEDPVPVKPLKQTLLCEGDEGMTPFTLRCRYFYLDENNNEVDPADTVNWALDIALEGIPQRFYSLSTGNDFFTEIDRPGKYTLTATNSGNKTSLPVLVVESTDTSSTITRQVPVNISSAKHEAHERILEASPGYEIINATIEVHPNNSRVSSRVAVSSDHTSARVVVELQPKTDAFNVARAWFAGYVVLTERKISN